MFPKHENIEAGFTQCVKLREENPEKFDEEIREKIELRQDEEEEFKGDKIWIPFVKKFFIVTELTKFIPFFKILLKSTIESHIE